MPNNRPNGQNGSPHEVWYRFNGQQFGYSEHIYAGSINCAANNGTFDVSTDRSIAQRQQGGPDSPGTFKGGQTIGLSYAEFAKGVACPESVSGIP